MSLNPLLDQYRQRLELALEARLPSAEVPPLALHQAMRYVCLDGGKRVRPALVYMAGSLFGVPLHALDGPACAVELIHAYSLVHDDLPAMDDDDLRRGKPTCHKAFDEATAILAGDALQALAFEILASDPEMGDDAARRLRQVATLANAAGAPGMCGGQAIDIAAEGQPITVEQLEQMHAYKTGALIRASVALGALAAPEVDAATLARLDTYAACIGLAFQIRDDILDVEASTEVLGKPQGSDAERGKATYTSLLGLDAAKAKAHALNDQAQAALEGFGAAADPLRWISAYIVERAN